jgi:hypothetical protein
MPRPLQCHTVHDALPTIILTLHRHVSNALNEPEAKPDTQRKLISAPFALQHNSTSPCTSNLTLITLCRLYTGLLPNLRTSGQRKERQAVVKSGAVISLQYVQPFDSQTTKGNLNSKVQEKQAFYFPFHCYDCIASATEEWIWSTGTMITGMGNLRTRGGKKLSQGHSVNYKSHTE